MYEQDMGGVTSECKQKSEEITQKIEGVTVDDSRNSEIEQQNNDSGHQDGDSEDSDSSDERDEERIAKRRRTLNKVELEEEEADNECINNFLDKCTDQAEARLAARRQARAEAREIRMRELERQQREQEENADRAYDMLEPVPRAARSVSTTPHRIIASVTNTGLNLSSRRSSEDSLEDGGRDGREIRHELKELEDKFRKAMIANAQLDNDKAAQTYQLELLKDRIEELEEEYTQLKREHRETCREHDQLKRVSVRLKEELAAFKYELEERDRLIAEKGLVIVGEEIAEGEENVDGTPRIPKKALVSAENAEMLENAGEGSLGPKIKKIQRGRLPISEGARLALTLRHLAAGDSIATLAFAFRIGKSTTCNIINETCAAIYEELIFKFVQYPTTEMWKHISNGFYTRWNMFNCVGALDGKHIQIQAPANSGSAYYNYKKHFSIVLFAMCDFNYKFTFVDVGAYGSQSDGGILRNSTLGQMMFSGNLDLPNDTIIPGTQTFVAHYFVGDEAFPLRRNLMRPFGGRNLNEDERIFNYRLSRARRCIENAFGIMVARFRIFHRVIIASPHHADNIVLACVCLHNFIKTLEEEMEPHNRMYGTPRYEDREDNGKNIPGDWRNDVPSTSVLQPTRTLGRLGARNATEEAIHIRNNLKQYFNSPLGQVPWQNDVL